MWDVLFVGCTRTDEDTIVKFKGIEFNARSVAAVLQSRYEQRCPGIRDGWYEVRRSIRGYQYRYSL